MAVELVRKVPLLSAKTLENLMDRHTATDSSATVVTAVVDNPYGYGRIVRDGSPRLPIAGLDALLELIRETRRLPTSAAE